MCVEEAVVLAASVDGVDAAIDLLVTADEALSTEVCGLNKLVQNVLTETKSSQCP